MVSWGSVVRGTTIAAGVVLLLSGCNSGSDGGDGGSEAVSSSTAAPLPGYDPCTQIPQSALDSLQLHGKIPRESTPGSGFEWSGCGWVRSDWYAVDIWVTNGTVDQFREQSTAVNPVIDVKDPHELTIAGRRAISHRMSGDHPDQECTIDVEIKGGSLEFGLSNPKENRKGGGLDSCELAKEVADQVVPSLPADV